MFYCVKIHVLEDVSYDKYRDMAILPNPSTHELLARDMSIHIARCITTYLPAFKGFSKVVPWHINHKYSEEMSHKSEIVSLKNNQ